MKTIVKIIADEVERIYRKEKGLTIPECVEIAARKYQDKIKNLEEKTY